MAGRLEWTASEAEGWSRCFELLCFAFRADKQGIMADKEDKGPEEEGKGSKEEVASKYRTGAGRLGYGSLGPAATKADPGRV